MTSRYGRTWGVALIGLLAALLPGTQPAGDVAPSTAAAPAVVQAPFDVGAVLRQVQRAFRPGPDGHFHGRDERYRVRAAADGFEFTPLQANAAPARFGAAQLLRDGARLDAAGAPRVEADGSLALAAQAYVERLVNRAEGVEQTWAFARAPAGEGDLTVRVPVSGLRFERVSDAGLHFAQASGAGVRYGHATWVDAAGQRTALPARWEAGAIALRVPASLLARSRYPAVLDPIISAELDVGVPVTTPAHGAFPAIAFNGTDYLVAWAGNRTHTHLDIVATRVKPDGTVLDAPGLTLATTARGGVDGLAVTATGTDFFVAWTDTRGGEESEDLYGTWVRADGALSHPAGLALSTAAGQQDFPSLAFDGTRVLAAWSDRRAGYGEPRAYATQVTLDGTVLHPLGFSLSSRATQQDAVVVASDGTGFFAAWLEGWNGIYGTRLAADGTVLDVQGRLLASTQTSRPQLGFGGGVYLLAWQEPASGTNPGIRATRVRPDGTVLDASGVVLTAASSTLTRRNPEVAFNGQSFLVAWDAYDGTRWDLEGMRLRPDGVVLDATPRLLASDVGSIPRLAVAADGTDFRVAYGLHRNNEDVHIRGTRVSAAGVAESPSGQLLSAAGNRQALPAIAFNGSLYLVAWEDYRLSSTYPTPYAARVRPDGMVLDPAGIALSQSVGAGSFMPLAVASNGADFLVAWMDQRSGDAYEAVDIYGTRVRADGSVLDPTGLALSTAPGRENSVSAASDGTDYLVVWGDHRNGASAQAEDIYGTRVRAADGAVLEPNGLALSAASGQQNVPTVAFGGGTYLAAWADVRAPDTHAVFAARVRPDGRVMDPAGVQLTSGTTYSQYPQVAFSGTDFLVAWSALDATSKTGLVGTRVRPDGTVVDPGGLALGPQGLMPRAMVGLDSGYVLLSSKHYPAVIPVPYGTQDLYATRVSAAGVSCDPAGLLLREGMHEISGFALAKGASTGARVVLDRYDDAAGTYRLKLLDLAAGSAPTATAQTLSTPVGTALQLTLTGTDADEDPLTFEVVTPPAHGTLSGTAPALTYTPASGYTGPDSFTFRATDCMSSSAPATVSLAVGSSSPGGGGTPPGANGDAPDDAGAGGCAAAGGGGALGLLPLALRLLRRRSRGA